MLCKCQLTLKPYAQCRLSKLDQAAAAHLVFAIVRHRGYWRTLHAKKHSSAFPGQEAAITVTKKLAKTKRDQGYTVEVVLRRTDGNNVMQQIDQ